MAKIQFTQDTEIEVCESFDEENDQGEFFNQIFRKGDIESEVDIAEAGQSHVDLQFGDGSMAFFVPTNLFTIIESD